MLGGVNAVIGSWIVGAVVMAEYTRFAKRAWVAIAIPFIVLIIAQWFLQIVGALGGVVYGGDGDFTSYLREQAGWIALLGVVGMSVALWTTGDANLYLPVIQTSSIMRRPRRVMTVICGLLGTLLGLGIYQYFLTWIGTLAIIVPPLIGPVIAHYYIVARGRMNANDDSSLPAANWAALLAYPLGLLSYFFAPEWLVPALSGLVGSMVAYLILHYAFGGRRAGG
ncbi:cytosine permease [Candidatus Foliamicus sp.]